MSHIREVDAIVQVVRCFEDPDVVHVSGVVDPIADIDTIETELVLADMQTLENALGKAQRTARAVTKRPNCGSRSSKNAISTWRQSNRCERLL